MLTNIFTRSRKKNKRKRIFAVRIRNVDLKWISSNDRAYGK